MSPERQQIHPCPQGKGEKENIMKNIINNITLHNAYEFVGPCMLESGPERASTITRTWLNAHNQFNAEYNGRNLVLTAINNENDTLTTSEVVAVESAGAWIRVTTRNSVINLWDEGAAAKAKAHKPVYPVPMPTAEPSRHERAILSSWEAGVAAEKALGHYCLGTYQPVAGKPFGFIDSIHGDVFAYGLGDKPVRVVYDTVETPKGLRVSEWRLATADDVATVNAAIDKALAEKQAKVDQRCRALADDRHRQALEAWETEKRFFEERGFYAVNVACGRKNNYGRAVWEEYKFSRAIDENEFVAYLKAMNINLTPETVEAPVCQGEIHLYRDGYRWATTGVSDNWTRYESFVYYD